ncbi:hypothetical protein [Pseudomonas sp. IPO3774]|uniref:hypothetical protein n=1 Tax=Pseudomonas sp. IPO3774 TaxID=2738826 RepID=UPI00210EA54F|nr:hypothetical protein [Pseudomonas sp. IPO3774]
MGRPPSSAVVAFSAKPSVMCYRIVALCYHFRSAHMDRIQQQEALARVMHNTDSNIVHEATAAALGFYYQSQFALLTLLSQSSDDAEHHAAVAVERLDDVELRANEQTLLYQLKHS